MNANMDADDVAGRLWKRICTAEIPPKLKSHAEKAQKQLGETCKKVSKTETRRVESLLADGLDNRDFMVELLAASRQVYAACIAAKSIAAVCEAQAAPKVETAWKWGGVPFEYTEVGNAWLSQF